MKIILQQNKEYLKYRNKKCKFYDIYGVIKGYFKINENEILFLLEIDKRFKTLAVNYQKLHKAFDPQDSFYEGDEESEVIIIEKNQIGKIYFELLNV